MLRSASKISSLCDDHSISLPFSLPLMKFPRTSLIPPPPPPAPLPSTPSFLARARQHHETYQQRLLHVHRRRRHGAERSRRPNRFLPDAHALPFPCAGLFFSPKPPPRSRPSGTTTGTTHNGSPPTSIPHTHTHTHTHTHARTRTHEYTNGRTHARTHARSPPSCVASFSLCSALSLLRSSLVGFCEITASVQHKEVEGEKKKTKRQTRQTEEGKAKERERKVFDGRSPRGCSLYTFIGTSILA